VSSVVHLTERERNTSRAHRTVFLSVVLALDAHIRYNADEINAIYKLSMSSSLYVFRVLNSTQATNSLVLLYLCSSGRTKNPFLPYDENLWVQHLSESHTLLLNKFNLVEHHVLVVTRSFESQDDPLNSKDFSASWKALQVRVPHKNDVVFLMCLAWLSGTSQQRPWQVSKPAFASLHCKFEMR
jgi:hypothetical protein